jgi:hypothetical protein
MKEELVKIFDVPKSNESSLSDDAKEFLEKVLNELKSGNAAIGVLNEKFDTYEELQDVFPSFITSFQEIAMYYFFPNSMILHIAFGHRFTSAQFLSEEELLFGSEAKNITPLVHLMELEEIAREEAELDCIDLDDRW